MARELPAGMAEAIAARVVRYALLLDCDYVENDVQVTVRAWAGTGVLSFEGYDWQGLGRFLGFNKVQETGDLSARGLEIRLAGVAASDIASTLAAVRTKLPGRIRLAALDADYQVIGAKTLFRGRLSVPRIKDAGEKCTASMLYEHEGIDLDRPREWRFTDEHQRLLYPDDTSLRFIAGLIDAEVIFGRR